MTIKTFRIFLLFSLLVSQAGVPGLAQSGSAHLDNDFNQPAAAESELLEGITAVASGRAHNCVLTDVGGVKCWGDNIYGELGDGTNSRRNAPVDVTGLGSGVTALAAGPDHTCAILNGGVKCWGYNYSGQLGDGSTINRNTPVNVSSLSSGVIAIDAGNGHTCALKDNGALLCWGYNYYGQLGIDNTTNQPYPAAVYGLSSGVISVSAGLFHTCAVISGGVLKCWGQNSDAQLGDGTSTERHSPVNVSGLGGSALSVTAGDNHSCAVTADHGAKCWGGNWWGQLGDGTDTESENPVAVSGLGSGVAALVASYESTCALTTGGAVKCWGANYQGQLGDGTTTQRSEPVQVSGLTSGVLQISSNTVHFCAVVNNPQSSSRIVKCWGGNWAGQLGDGAITRRSNPVALPALGSEGSSISLGYSHTCAILPGGALKCWGDNRYGQLGDGSLTLRSTPANVTGMGSGVTIVNSGREHTCALNGGQVYCWGNNQFGRLGDGTTTNRSTPVKVSGLSGVTALAPGGSHTCALISGGGVKCWGLNAFGQLGDGTFTDRHTPVNVSGLGSGVSALAAGSDHTCALTGGGAILCWGANYQGQLGNSGLGTESAIPLAVSGITGTALGITAGEFHNCARVIGDSLKCWGANWNGQIGDGTTDDRYAPVDVPDLSGIVSQVIAGSNRTCVRTNTNGVKCWGQNYGGELGDGTLDERHTPVDVNGLTGGVTNLDAGIAHTCAILSTQRVKCWGEDLSGQLGLGVYPLRTTPVEVRAAFPSRLDLSAGFASPGSYITVTGENYNPGAQLAVSANGYSLSTNLQVNATGGFIFFLDTSAADPGFYGLAVGNVQAILQLDPVATAYGLEGGGQVLVLPAVSIIPEKLYLPALER